VSPEQIGRVLQQCAGHGFHVDLARPRHWKPSAAGALYFINDVWPINLTGDLFAG
jgi:hypothetical protein